MISDLESFVAFAAPHVADRRVLVVGTRSWMDEAGLLPCLRKLAESVRTTEPHEFLDRAPARNFEAVVFYEDLGAYDGIRSVEFAADCLTERGRVVCELFTPDTLDGATVAWLVNRINERWPGSTSPRDVRLQWNLENEERLALSTESLRAALDARFDEVAFDVLPALDRGEVLELDGLDPGESALVDEIFELEEQALARGEIFSGRLQVRRPATLSRAAASAGVRVAAEKQGHVLHSEQFLTV